MIIGKKLIFLFPLSLTLIFIILISGCDKGKSSKAANITYLKESKNQYEKNGNSAHAIKTKNKINVPSGFSIIKPVSYTTYMGECRHPTIQGGIINSPDQIPSSVSFTNDDEKINNSTSNNVYERSNVTNNYSGRVNNIDPFKDDWVNSKKVKAILVKASQDGKLDYLLQKATQYQIPASVAIIPMVESTYNNNAISNKGALGAWQLMPSVASENGINRCDCFDFKKSTDTALKILVNLNEHFNNWELSFAAYNAGSHRVQKALNNQPNAKTIDDLSIPYETKVFVNRIKKISKIIETMNVNT